MRMICSFLPLMLTVATINVSHEKVTRLVQASCAATY